MGRNLSEIGRNLLKMGRNLSKFDVGRNLSGTKSATFVIMCLINGGPVPQHDFITTIRQSSYELWHNHG